MPALLLDQAGTASRFIAIKPVVNGIGRMGFENPLAGNGVRTGTVRDAEEGSGAFAQVRTAVVIAQGDQFGALVIREREGASLHDRLLSRDQSDHRTITRLSC